MDTLICQFGPPGSVAVEEVMRATLRVPVNGTDCSCTSKPLAVSRLPRYSAARRSSGVALRRGPIVSARCRTVVTDRAASKAETASWS